MLRSRARNRAESGCAQLGIAGSDQPVATLAQSRPAGTRPFTAGACVSVFFGGLRYSGSASGRSAAARARRATLPTSAEQARGCSRQADVGLPGNASLDLSPRFLL